MRTVTVSTLKTEAEELVAKAIAGEATMIEQGDKRAVLLPCEGEAPDFELFPQTDRLLRERLASAGGEPTAADWLSLRESLR
jgi:hypothetical protein